MRALVVQKRFAKKFAHLSIDLSRPEIAIIEKNLEPRARLLVVIRQRHRDFRNRRWRKSWCRHGSCFWRHAPDWFRCRSVAKRPPYLSGGDGRESKNRRACSNHHERGFHSRKLCAEEAHCANRQHQSNERFLSATAGLGITRESYRVSPFGNITRSGAVLSAARSFGIRRLLSLPASRGATT